MGLTRASNKGCTSAVERYESESEMHETNRNEARERPTLKLKFESKRPLIIFQKKLISRTREEVESQFDSPLLLRSSVAMLNGLSEIDLPG